MKKMVSAILAIMVLTVCGISAAGQEARKVEKPADADEFIAIFLGEHSISAVMEKE